MRLALALAFLLAFPGAAFAHVTVVPEFARPGETVDLTFRVPNERDDAATVRLDVFLPRGVPAEIAPHEGWTHVLLPTGEVRWTADDGAQLGPGRTADFKVRLGPLPERDEIVFKSLQHYADGEVVRWIQTGGPDDERPAAVLTMSVPGAEQAGTSPLLYVIFGLVSVGIAVAIVIKVTR